MKRRSLTADKIIDAAMEVADAEGVEALSMRKLASLLNVTAMSLYNHVGSKDEVLELMLGRVVTQIARPEAGGYWETMMRRRAHSMREVLLSHRWASTLLISRISMGDAILRDIEATLGCLVAGGFTYRQADWARNAIDSHVYGYTFQELNTPVDPDEYRSAAATYLPMISQAEYPHIHEASLEIAKGEYDGRTDFSFGLELILKGLRNWVAGTAP